MADISLRKRIWGWFFFDWASQPYHTVLITFIFGPFFAVVAAQYFAGQGFSDAEASTQAQSLWAWAMALFGIIIALFAPLFGAMADSTGRKLPWIIGFSAMYVLGSSALWFTYPDASNLYWMLALFGVGFIGAEWALIFINAQLPGLGTREEVGSISGKGFSFGYLGGVMCLAIALLLLVEQPNGKTLLPGMDPLFGLNAEQREGTRATGLLVALWFAVFMIPYFLWVREVRSDHQRPSVRAALRSVGASLSGLLSKPSLRNFLIGSMFYRDALNGLYTFGGIYAVGVLNWSVVQVGVFGVVAALGAAVLSYVGGFIDQRVGPRPVVLVTIWGLIAICFTVISLTPTTIFGIALAEGSGLPNTIFMICGILIGGLGGVLQSASRSLMTRHTTEEKSTEYFGLYGLSGRATAFLAPLLIGIVTTLTASKQLGIAPVILLFVVGLLFLRSVRADGE